MSPRKTTDGNAQDSIKGIKDFLPKKKNTEPKPKNITQTKPKRPTK